MILLLEYFEFDNKDRMDEINHCLSSNSNNLFDRIIVFTQLEKSEFLDGIECEVIKIDERVTYQFIFDWCDRNITEDIFVLSNSDILFNDTIRLVEGIHENEFYCISRHETVEDNIKLYHSAMCSQDVWVWKNRCRIKKADFSLGVPGCDNRISNIAGSFGYLLLNPSKSVICEHFHSSDFRSYTEGHHRIKGEYTYVDPNNIHEKETKLTKSHSGPCEDGCDCHSKSKPTDRSGSPHK